MVTLLAGMFKNFIGMNLIKLIVGKRQRQMLKIPDNVRFMLGINVQSGQISPFTALIHDDFLDVV